MELFLLEHKKLWRKTSVKISVLLCFINVVVFGNILSYQMFTFGSWQENKTGMFRKHFDGYEMIRASQEYAGHFSGELSDQKLQQIVRDYQRLDEDEREKTDWHKINNWLKTCYPELERTEMEFVQIMLCYADADKITDFYGRRQQAIDEFLKINGQEGKEKEYLMGLEQKVKKPFQYEWTEGWSVLLGSMIAELGSVLALFLAIVLSSLFAGEWHYNFTPLILTTKNGWGKIAAAKILTGLSFTLELFLMLTVSNVAAQIFFLGTAGWDMPVQNIKLIAVAPMNMVQAEIYEYMFALLGSVGFAGVVMLLSAFVKNHVLALLFSLAVVYGPMMIRQYVPYGVEMALDLIPLAGSGADIFRTNTFCLFGRYIWSPYLLITIPVLIGILCMPLAVRGWSGRLKS